MLDHVLERLRHRIAAADELVAAFAEWLGVFDLGAAPVGKAAGLWTAREVAIAGLREATGKATARPFATGLSWLREREFFRPYVAPVFEADPLAILAVALGIRHSGEPAAKQWIAELAKRAAHDETEEWRTAMLAGAVAAVTNRPVPRPAELIVALAARGIGAADAATWQAAIEAALVLDEVPAERAAVRLAALSRASTPSLAGGTSYPINGGEVNSRNHKQGSRSVRILFLAANPSTTDQVLLSEEVRSIQEKISLAEHRSMVKFETRWAVRPNDLQHIILQTQPTIIQFSGHGAGSAGTVLHGDIPGTEHIVPAGALKHVFSTLKGNIRVIVLNTCESAEHANEISEVIDFVIGMDDKIDDESARCFSAELYLGIASGVSVRTAFQMGIGAVKLRGLPDDHVPRLYLRAGVSGDEVLVG